MWYLHCESDPVWFPLSVNGVTHVWWWWWGCFFILELLLVTDGLSPSYQLHSVKIVSPLAAAAELRPTRRAGDHRHGPRLFIRSGMAMDFVAGCIGGKTHCKHKNDSSNMRSEVLSSMNPPCWSWEDLCDRECCSVINSSFWNTSSHLYKLLNPIILWRTSVRLAVSRSWTGQADLATRSSDAGVAALPFDGSRTRPSSNTRHFSNKIASHISVKYSLILITMTKLKQSLNSWDCLPVASTAEQALATPTSWVQFSGHAWTDHMWMKCKSLLDTSICQMHECKRLKSVVVVGSIPMNAGTDCIKNTVNEM